MSASPSKSISYVFLSYMREDRHDVDRLREDLSSYGISLWVDRHSIRAGARWERAVQEAIERCRYFVAWFSERTTSRALSSSFMGKELRQAGRALISRARGREWLIPLRAAGHLPSFTLAPGLSVTDFQAIDLREKSRPSGLWSLATRLFEANGETERLIAVARGVWRKGDLAQRRFALDRLFGIRADPRTLGLFARALRDRDDQIYSLAADALSSMGPAGVAELEKAACGRCTDEEYYMTVAWALTRTERLSSRVLRQFVKDMQSFHQGRATSALSVVAAQLASHPYLLRQIRRALELGTIDGDEAIQELKSSSSSAARRLADEVRRILALDDKLCRALTSEHGRVARIQRKIEAHGLLALSILLWRSYADEVRVPLARIGARHLPVLIARAAMDESRGRDAVRLLGEIGSPLALAALRKLRYNPSYGNNAREAIERIEESQR